MPFSASPNFARLILSYLKVPGCRGLFELHAQLKYTVNYSDTQLNHCKSMPACFSRARLAHQRDRVSLALIQPKENILQILWTELDVCNEDDDSEWNHRLGKLAELCSGGPQAQKDTCRKAFLHCSPTTISALHQVGKDLCLFSRLLLYLVSPIVN